MTVNRSRNAACIAATAVLVMALTGMADAEPKPQTSYSSAGAVADKYDTSLPVEISSETLEVLQHENKAIFKGNVIAVQGKIRLTSDTMIVHYKQKTDDAKPGATPPAKPAAADGKPGSQPARAEQGAMGAITLIEVHGNVFVATPEESAKGDDGDYKVPEKLLHLTGDNVILTRDKNILRGTDLVYSLESGHSVLTNKGAPVTGTNGGRVRGIFIPNQDNKNKSSDKNKAKSTSATPAAAEAPVSPAGASQAPVQ